MSDTYNVGRAGAVGKNSSATNFSFTDSPQQADSDQLRRLADELAVLRKEMKLQATEPGDDVAVAEVAQAEEAAKAGDATKAQTHLARAGKWALQTATALGVALAVAAIKSAGGI